MYEDKIFLLKRLDRVITLALVIGIIITGGAGNIYVLEPDEPADPELGLIPDRLMYLAYYMGLTSTTSLRVEAQEFDFDDEADTGWANVNWAKLLSTQARIDLQLGSVWAVGASNGLRAAAAYGWPAGLNLDLTVRLWDVPTGALLKTFEGHKGWVVSVCLAFVISGGTTFSTPKDFRLSKNARDARISITISRRLSTPIPPTSISISSE